MKNSLQQKKLVRIIFSKLTSRTMIWGKQKCTFGKPVTSAEYTYNSSFRSLLCYVIYSVCLEFTRQGIEDWSSRKTRVELRSVSVCDCDCVSEWMRESERECVRLWLCELKRERVSVSVCDYDCVSEWMSEREWVCVSGRLG
jgi:hypothetical protein